MVSEAMTGDGHEPRWYVAYTRSRHEKSVVEQFHRKEIEAFLPLYQTTHRWKNGDHRVQMPLFPGYAFVRIPLRDRLRVLKVPGVIHLVGFGGAPTPLGDEEVEGLRQALLQGLQPAPYPYLTEGQRVRVTAGPLVGRVGILLRRRSSKRVVLSIDLIQRSIVVDVEANCLEPAR